MPKQSQTQHWGDDDSRTHRNTISFNANQLDEFLDRQDAKDSGRPGTDQRHFVRWPFREISVKTSVVEGGSSARELWLAVRNVSNSGISALHSSFIYPGSTCELTLPTRHQDDGAPLVLRGCVVRCIHIEGIIHEIGIRFDQPIDSSKFVAKLMPANSGPDFIDTENLSGTILHIDDSEVDRRLIAHFLADTKIKLEEAGTLEEARKLSNNRYDLILCDQLLPDGHGSDFVRWLRDQCISTPVAMHSATAIGQLRQEMKDVEIQGLLAKPIDKDTLLRAMTEFLSTPHASTEQENDDQPARNDPEMKKIAGVFRAELEATAQEIDEAVKAEDPLKVYAIAIRLKGTAPSLGFKQLGKIAGKAAESVAATMSCEESTRQVRALIESCEQNSKAA